MSGEFADHFSGHAADYARYRPSPPEPLLDWLAASAPARGAAWDCATGSGQVARSLAGRFDHVYATDASRAQLSHAAPHPRVTFSQALAQQSGLPDACVDLVTVGVALHWFDEPAFYAEAARVLRPGGLLAAWTYLPRGLPDPLPEAMSTFRADLEPFWPSTTQHETYRPFPPPFEDVPHPGFALRLRWSVDDWAGFIGTWSAVRRAREARGTDPVAALVPRLRAVLGDGPHPLDWPLEVRVGRR